MKTLYVLPSNNGDGSCTIKYTFNMDWIMAMEEAYSSGEDFDYERWADGDGFHYDSLTVPDECTLKSLGILYDCAGE